MDGPGNRFGDGTRVVRAGLPHPAPGQPFLPGPAMAATFPLDPATGPVPGVDSYGRSDSSTRRLLEAAIGELEGGDCLAFASGMAAISALLLAIPRPGDTVVLPADGYYLTRSWAEKTLTPLGVRVVVAPTAGPYPGWDNVRRVRLETPANPGRAVCDIAELSAAAHAHGALVAMKGSSVEAEIEEAASDLERWGCAPPTVHVLGEGVVESTTVALRVVWADPAQVSWPLASGRGKRGSSRPRRTPRRAQRKQGQ